MPRRLVLSLGLLAAIGVAGGIWWLTRPVDSHGDDEAARRSGSPEAPPDLATSPAPAPRLEGTKRPGEAPVQTAVPKPAAAAEEAKPASDPAAKPTGILHVRVTYKGEPHPDATLRVRPKTGDLRPTQIVKADAKGRAQFDGVDVKTIAVDVVAEGFRLESYDDLEYRVPASAGIVQFELSPGIPLDGHVVDARTGSPIADAGVIVSDWTQGFDVGPTDAKGAFHAPGVMNDQVTTIVARAKGYATQTVKVRVQDGHPQEGAPIVRLVQGGAVVGTVVTADGKPASGASVRIAPAKDRSPESEQAGQDSGTFNSVENFEYDDEILESVNNDLTRGVVAEVKSGADGMFRADGLPLDQDLEVTARAPKASSAVPVGGIRLTDGAPERTVSLALRRPAVALLRVTLPDGAALPERARIRLFRANRLHRPDGREADGRFRFDSADPGPAFVFVQADGFRSAMQKILLQEGATVEVELKLEAGAAVEGIVVDGDGNPLAGAEVQLAAANDNTPDYKGYLHHERKATTDSQGRFTIGGVPPGAVVLIAEWGDWQAHRWLGTREHMKFSAPAKSVRVALSRLGEMRLRLVTSGGTPFVGEVWLTLQYADGGSGGGSRQVEDGVVDETRLDDGEWGWVVRPTGFAWMRKTAQIRDGSLVDFGDVVVDAGVAVSGRVVDGRGHPVPEADVMCKEVEERTTRTDAEGRFSFERFPHGPFSFEIKAEGFVDGVLTVEPSKTTGIEFHLLRRATVNGVIKTAAGAVAAGAAQCVTLRRPDAILRHSKATGLDGKPSEYDYYEGDEFLGVDATGHFQGSVPPGRWIVSCAVVEAKDDIHVGEWTLTDGETREIEIVLPAK